MLKKLIESPIKKMVVVQGGKYFNKILFNFHYTTTKIGSGVKEML